MRSTAVGLPPKISGNDLLQSLPNFSIRAMIKVTQLEAVVMKPTTVFPNQSRDLIIGIIALVLAILILGILPIPVV
ncbi:MAG: hypothetical protein ACKO7W_24370 [Elainella sp.]